VVEQQNSEPVTGPEPGPEPDAGPGGAAPASLKRRFGALLIDWLLCLSAAGVFGRISDPLVPSLVLIGEYAFFVGLFGQTPGMRLAKIACLSVPDGRPIGLGRALVRGFLLAILVPALLMDRDQRGLHDRLVGSQMVATDPVAARR
jgi:uncharacterized RDD family membrane protein YckC